ncbi:MAG: hypothetical protein AB7T59_11760 [Hyphomonadaceae bacterium]
MKHVFAAVIGLALCGVASAQEATAPAATPAPAQDAAAPTYAVPVESIRLGGANARLVETGASAGGYSLIQRQALGAFNSQVFGQTRIRYAKRYRFVQGEDNVVFTGACRMSMEWQSMFGVQYDQRTNQAYTCDFENQAAEQYALEVAIPAFNETRGGFGNFSFTAAPDVDPAVQQAILRGRMVYQGVPYDALPTGFRRERGGFERRVVAGYTVTRDGALVGRIDFDESNQNNRATVTVPVAEADGRAAVLLLLLHLNNMPDMYSTRTREEVMQF